MALTIARVTNSNFEPKNGGAVNQSPVRITFDSSYPTGGESLTASSLGLNTVTFVAIGLSTAGAHSAVYDDATGKILVFTTADGLQVANTTNLSAIVFPALVFGL